MPINPEDYEVSVDTLQDRLHLPKDIRITPFGYEKNLDDLVLGVLKTKYDVGALFLRTRPDFFVIDDDGLYFVEAKQKTKNVEAIQLFYNKQLEKIGIKIVYSFPNVTIHARDIPMEKIVIPKNYAEKFDKHLKHLFKSEGLVEDNFCYVGLAQVGSGDAFVPIDEDDLKLLSDEIGV